MVHNNYRRHVFNARIYAGTVINGWHGRRPVIWLAHRSRARHRENAGKGGGRQMSFCHKRRKVIAKRLDSMCQ